MWSDGLPFYSPRPEAALRFRFANLSEGTMKKLSWKLRGAAAASCACLLATFACSGSSTTDSTPTADTGAPLADSGGPDAAVSDAGSVDSAPGDAGQSDALAQADAPDSTTTADAADAAMPLAPLALCAALDTRWGEASADRAASWANDIMNEYATEQGGDCRIANMGNSLTQSQGTDYSNELIAWTLHFFGCAENDAGALNFSGPIPPALSNHVFTTADLKVLADLYTSSVVTAISNVGGTPLSSDQINQINAQLAGLAAATPGVLTSDTYTFGNCISDGGNSYPECFCPGERSTGNLLRDSIADLWNSPVMQEYRRRMSEDRIAGFCSDVCVTGKVDAAMLSA